MIYGHKRYDRSRLKHESSFSSFHSQAIVKFLILDLNAALAHTIADIKNELGYRKRSFIHLKMSQATQNNAYMTLRNVETLS